MGASRGIGERRGWCRRECFQLSLVVLALTRLFPSYETPLVLAGSCRTFSALPSEALSVIKCSDCPLLRYSLGSLCGSCVCQKSDTAGACQRPQMQAFRPAEVLRTGIGMHWQLWFVWS